MSIIDVLLFALATVFLFWIIAVAWEEWRKKALSEITLATLAVALTFTAIVTLSVLDTL